MSGFLHLERLDVFEEDEEEDDEEDDDLSLEKQRLRGFGIGILSIFLNFCCFGFCCW